VDREVIARIKEKVNIADVISERVEGVKRTGRGFSALCPFHQEKTPSFTFSPEKGYFKCFGCGESGDAITFLQKIDGLTFPEALKQLGQVAGIEVSLKRETPQETAERVKAVDERTRLIYCLDSAIDLFMQKLPGSLAEKYIKSRNFTQETLESFCIGYAPENNALLKAAGRPIFLIGMLKYEGGILNPLIAFARDFAEERAIMQYAFAEIASSKRVFTWNGTSFDLNRMKRRSVSIPIPWSEPSEHIDLLHQYRRSEEFPNCRLSALEKVIFGHHRISDIPGEEVPMVYKRFVLNGNAERIAGVVNHNLQDLFTLAALSAYAELNREKTF